MPGQLNLTGANAAIQLVGNDTITEDQEFAFPDTGGTVVTDDFNGDVEIDGTLKAGTDNFFEWRPTFGVCQLSTTSSNADQAILYGESQVGGSTFDAFKITCGGDVTASSVTSTSAHTGAFNSTDNFAEGVDITSEGEVYIQCASSKSSSFNVLRGYYGSNERWSVTADGSASFTNTLFYLDSDDPTRVLDVKESIRTMQAALYRLKAAVLIPNASVDEMRLRILEALETITEEVD